MVWGGGGGVGWFGVLGLGLGVNAGPSLGFRVGLEHGGPL